jgi:hypothetical protein
MSVMLTIGSDGDRNLTEVSSSWINEQINRRKKDGIPLCVRVLIKTDCVNVALATIDCACSRGGGRIPNHHEREILELWSKLHLNDANFSAGNLIAFLKQVA